VEGGAYLEEVDQYGTTALKLAIRNGRFKIVVYLVEQGANVARTDVHGMTALLWACDEGDLSTVKYFLGHGSSITERDPNGKTGLLFAASRGRFQLVQFLHSLLGGASITETDHGGHTALLQAAMNHNPKVVQWLLEYGDARITDINSVGDSVWTEPHGLRRMLQRAYTKNEDGEYVTIDGEYVRNVDVVALAAMLRVMMLHGSPPESLVVDLAPPLQQIVRDGARLRSRLPAYLVQRRGLIDAYCPLLAPLMALVRGYDEPTTTDELWATGLGVSLQRAKRSRPERSQSPERRSARLRQ
jgi:hypothetical protein